MKYSKRIALSETSAVTASRFLATYTPPPRRTFRRPIHRPTDSELFREIVLDHVGRFPRRAIDIQTAVIDDYGPSSDRRFWRALKYLTSLALIERTDVGYRRSSLAKPHGKLILCGKTQNLSITRPS